MPRQSQILAPAKPSKFVPESVLKNYPTSLAPPRHNAKRIMRRDVQDFYALHK
jgi:hypothetical protein